MVDVGDKGETERIAIAQAKTLINAKTLALLREQALPKGDALGCARIAAILAAKRTPQLIPLCHSLNLTFVGVEFEIHDEPPSIRIIAEARCKGRTGVEMEAIVAAQTAAAVIYDMCKAVQKDIVITDTKLLFKSGGKSGEFRAPEY
ncbi:MAG: cyclic pyranopterin monophosphate synthase MoaC [Desulfovibrio sp.]|nr:cyclic pyranopterin monophosphate synthase MoaC [Desulfovibrio sp.]